MQSGESDLNKEDVDVVGIQLESVELCDLHEGKDAWWHSIPPAKRRGLIFEAQTRMTAA